MKNYKVFILFLFLLISCSRKGSYDVIINGDEPNLPEELKGVKVYDVSTGLISHVNIAVLNNSSSIRYGGKVKENTITIYSKNKNEFIEVKEKLLENDSIIIFRK